MKNHAGMLIPGKGAVDDKVEKVYHEARETDKEKNPAFKFHDRLMSYLQFHVLVVFTVYEYTVQPMSDTENSTICCIKNTFLE